MIYFVSLGPVFSLLLFVFFGGALFVALIRAIINMLRHGPKKK